ncbi:MAG: hypothetical protein BZY87_10250 [SAR202 cluster bacterium Io17-Chloro-G6]|nr:MAG: hypothetical protein BZY87_10250 [SAR202 cluster bacterium Io17-Chloro-G6]
MGIQKVMVVHDDASMRLDCRQMLVENGFDVAEAADGDEAISVYSEFQPDIVFMDITMPDMDCLLALQEIFEIDPRAKVAMSMDVDQQRSLMLAIKMGAVGFVIKPFSQEQILGTIRRSWN